MNNQLLSAIIDVMHDLATISIILFNIGTKCGGGGGLSPPPPQD